MYGTLDRWECIFKSTKFCQFLSNFVGVFATDKCHVSRCLAHGSVDRESYGSGFGNPFETKRPVVVLSPYYKTQKIGFRKVDLQNKDQLGKKKNDFTKLIPNFKKSLKKSPKPGTGLRPTSQRPECSEILKSVFPMSYFLLFAHAYDEISRISRLN